MKLFKILFFPFILCIVNTAICQTQLPTNANINIVTANAGIVNQGALLDLEVSVTNTGANSIQPNRVRASISIPIAIASAAGNALQIGLPSGWIITSNTGSNITVCNGADIIPSTVTRSIFIKITGNAIGGPSTILGALQFGPGTGVCTGFGSLNGDNPADNNSSTTITVVPSCPLTVFITAGSIACYGGTTTITATTTGAVGAVEYRLSTGQFQSSNIFTVPASTYTVVARQVGNVNCTALSTTIVISQPTAVSSPLIGITQPTCSVATGSVELSGLPLTSWTINPGNISGSGTSTTISNLSNGTYNFIVTNSAGCSSDPTASVVINTQPTTPAIPIVGSVAQATCTSPSASVILNGLPAGNWLIYPGNVSGTGSSSTIGNLSPGTFNFTVTNAEGCSSAATLNIVIDSATGIPAPPVVSVVQPTCTNPNATINVTTATSGLLFSFDNGAYVDYPSGGFTANEGNHTLSAQTLRGCSSTAINFVINAQPVAPNSPAISIIQPSCTMVNAVVTVTSDTTKSSFSLNGDVPSPYPVSGYLLSSGNYTLSAQDSFGCISTPTNFTVNAQPGKPSGSLTASSIFCNGGTSTLTVSAFGGVEPYEYSLDAGVTHQIDSTFIVPAGVYATTIKSANGCTGLSNTLTVSAPDAITALLSQGPAIACSGGLTTLTVSAGNGTPPFQYALNGGSFQTNNIFTVGAGTQTITVKDAKLCTKIANVETTIQPSILIIIVSAPRITACGGKTTVTVSARGGTAPYINTGTFVKKAGIYSFEVTDLNGCTAFASLDIEAAGCMDLRAFPNPASQFVTIDHTIAVEGATMKLYTVSGQKLAQQAVLVGAFTTTIDLRKFAAGSYVAVYQNSNDKKSIHFEKLK